MTETQMPQKSCMLEAQEWNTMLILLMNDNHP